MGFLSGLLGAAAPVVGGIFGGPAGSAIGGALGGALSSSGAPKNTTTTQQQQIDPRLASILYGQNGNQGLLQQIAAQAGRPQSAGQLAFGQGIDSYLGNYGTDTFNRSQQAAQGLQDIQRQAPQIGWSGDASSFQASQVNAPSQNSLNLKPAYNDFIYGNSAQNPYLLSSLQAGSNLANAGFQNNVRDVTDTLQRQVLPGIRSGAIAAGGYGGSRQGIAEGNALSDYTKQLTGANTQLSLGQQAGILGAQANTFNQGQDRALSALQGLSGQQYGTAQQNAQLAQQAQLANQQNAQQNANRNLTRDTTNAQLINQTNQQNDARNIAGAGLSSGLLGQALGYANQSNNADFNRLGQAAGFLSPFLNAGQSQTNTQPLYSNTGANVLGGAAAGLGLYNQFQNASGGARQANPGGISDAFNYLGYMG